MGIKFSSSLVRVFLRSIRPQNYTGSQGKYSQVKFITHPGVALLWLLTFGGAPARAPGRCVFEEQVGVGVHNARVSESTDVWVQATSDEGQWQFRSRVKLDKPTSANTLTSILFGNPRIMHPHTHLFFEDTPSGGPRRGASQGRHPQQSHPGMCN